MIIYTIGEEKILLWLLHKIKKGKGERKEQEQETDRKREAKIGYDGIGKTSKVSPLYSCFPKKIRFQMSYSVVSFHINTYEININKKQSY